MKRRLLNSCSINDRANKGSSSRAVTLYPLGDIIGGRGSGISTSALYQLLGNSRGVSVILFPDKLAKPYS
jgi:hypothetical protein